MKKTSENAKIQDLENEIVKLYQSNRQYLLSYPWEWEQGRWAELIFCLFVNGLGMDEMAASKTINLLREVRFLQVAEVLAASSEAKENTRAILIQSGLERKDARMCIDVLVDFAKITDANWNGHIQRFLREFGNKMAEELINKFSSTKLEVKSIKKVFIQWLQNSANLPLLSETDTHILDFLKKHRISQSELHNVNDQHGLSASLLSDLILVESKRKIHGKAKREKAELN